MRRYCMPELIYTNDGRNILRIWEEASTDYTCMNVCMVLTKTYSEATPQCSWQFLAMT